MGCHPLGSELGGQIWEQVTSSNASPDTARAEPGPGSGQGLTGSSRRQGRIWTLQQCVSKVHPERTRGQAGDKVPTVMVWCRAGLDGATWPELGWTPQSHGKGWLGVPSQVAQAHHDLLVPSGSLASHPKWWNDVMIQLFSTTHKVAFAGKNWGKKPKLALPQPWNAKLGHKAKSRLPRVAVN